MYTEQRHEYAHMEVEQGGRPEKVQQNHIFIIYIAISGTVWVKICHEWASIAAKTSSV